jgi:hypothetical protein
MTMIDMKNPPPKKEEKEKGLAVPTMPYGEEYPYGLRITLQTEQLEKLGLTAQSFNLGETGNLSAQYKVIETRENASVERGKKRKNMTVELQVIKLDIGPKGPSKASRVFDNLGKGPGE